MIEHCITLISSAHAQYFEVIQIGCKQRQTQQRRYWEMATGTCTVALAGSEPLAIPPPIPSKVLGAVLKNIWRVPPSARPVRPTRRTSQTRRTSRGRIAVNLPQLYLDLVDLVPELGIRVWPDRRQKWKHRFKIIEGCC